MKQQKKGGGNDSTARRDMNGRTTGWGARCEQKKMQKRGGMKRNMMCEKRGAMVDHRVNTAHRRFVPPFRRGKCPSSVGVSEKEGVGRTKPEVGSQSQGSRKGEMGVKTGVDMRVRRPYRLAIQMTPCLR